MVGRNARRCRLAVRAVAVTLLLAVAACAGGGGDGSAAGLPTRKQQLGALEVVVTPTKVDATGAAFTVAFDTHTGAPDLDVAASAGLTVDGVAWTNASWTGDGPGGHHRGGTLRFDPAGEARGVVRLSIGGLDQPLEMTWQLTT